MQLTLREASENLLKEHIKDEYLIKHSYMVAKGLESYAKKLNQDADLWYSTGLLHDLDYYEYPKEHPDKAVEWLTKWAFDKDMIHAIAAHGIKEPRVKPENDLAKYLIAVDETTGLLYAYSLMRPTGFIGMEAKSAMKKFKDKAFAAKIDRNEILYGVNLAGLDLKEHLDFLIKIF